MAKHILCAKQRGSYDTCKIFGMELRLDVKLPVVKAKHKFRQRNIWGFREDISKTRDMG